MADDLSIKEIIQSYRNAYPELKSLTDKQILSVLDDAAAGVNLNEDEQVSMFGLSEQGYSGLELERKATQDTIEEIVTLPQTTEENSDGSGIETAAIIGGVVGLASAVLSRGKIKSGIKNLRKFSSTAKPPKIYTRPKKIKFETIAEKVNNNPDLKKNPICEHLMRCAKREDFSAKDKKAYLTLLDMVAENKILSSNKNLINACEKGTFYYNSKSSLQFAEDFVNTPALRNNPHINASLSDIMGLYSFKHNEKYIKGVIDKFLKNDKSVISDIMKNHRHISNYYHGLPESIIGKNLAELNKEELIAVKQWFYTTKNHPPDSNLVRQFYPSIPSYKSDFPAFVKEIKRLESIDATPLSLTKLQEFNNDLFKLTELNNTEKVTSLIPELFPAGKDISKSSMETLKKISKTERFQNLSAEDKKILIMSTILQDTGGESAAIVSCCQRLGFTRVDSEKVVNIIKHSNLGEDFMKTTKNPIIDELHSGKIISTNRREFFENAAFDLKEENTFELAQILYSAKSPKGLTRNLDKMLSKRINEMKAGDFIMPQTPREAYIGIAKPLTIVKGDKSYTIRVVKRSEIRDFYGYLHTPINVSMMKEASITQNINKLELQASETMSDRIICTCFVDSKSNSFVMNRYNGCFAEGFIGQIPNSKQYVGAGADLSSIAKDRKSLIRHYYKDNGLTLNGASPLDGTYMADLRTIVSNNLKKSLNISDSEYIRRIDKIKKALGDETMSLEKLQEIDPEMATAYKKFLSKRIGEGASTSEAVLRSDYEWNEFLCSEFKPADIYTTDVNRLSTEFLEMASNPNRDMVVISMFE